MALSTQKGRSFYAFQLQTSIFGFYVPIFIKVINSGIREILDTHNSGKLSTQAITFNYIYVSFYLACIS